MGLFSTNYACEKCNTSKANIDKEKRKERAAIQKAQSGGGFFMGGITPSRDFLKCPQCGKVACSHCVSKETEAPEGTCPFCQTAYSADSFVYKSESLF